MNTTSLNRDRIFIIQILHILVLILSILLIVIISIDIFQNIPELTQKVYMKFQLWICLFFIFVFFLELFLSKRRMHFFFTHLIFLIVSIPYLNIFQYAGLHFDSQISYFLRFIPLIRGGYALSLVVSWLSHNTISTLFMTYLTILLSTVYFSSLLFFNVEKPINSLVSSYADSLWWAFMDVTTVGSNIYAVTAIGKILSVLLAAMGMMMFPIFTVYITDRITESNKKKKPILDLHLDNDDSEDAPLASESNAKEEK